MTRSCGSELLIRRFLSALVGNERREEPMMFSLGDVASDERTARRVLTMLVEANDPVTGRIMSKPGAVETLGIAESDGAVVGPSSVDAQVWRNLPVEVLYPSENYRPCPRSAR